MGCAFSAKSHSINREDERKRPELLTIVDNCQQRILSGIHRCLIAHLLGTCVCDGTCVRNVGFGLDAAQAMVDIYDQIKNLDRRDWRLCAHADMLNKCCRLSSDDPFRSLDVEEFHALVTDLQQVMEVLRQRRREINESLQSTKWWRNTCNTVTTVVIIMIIGSVVLAALVASPVGITTGTAAGTLMKTMEQWVCSIWEERKGALEEEQKVVEKMQAALQVLSWYDHLESLSSLVQKVKSSYVALASHMEYFLLKFVIKDVDNDDEEEEAIEIKMKDMKSKINALKAGMNLLINAAGKCNKTIRRAHDELSLIYA